MPEKKEKMSTVKKSDVKVIRKKNKSANFLRLGKARTKSVLKALRILGNCSNRTNYDYNKEQVESMFTTIQEKLDGIKGKFSQTKKEAEHFEF